MPVFIKNFFSSLLFHTCAKGQFETPIFMQDNAPCQKNKTALSFLEEERIAVMKWLPQSLHMNPLENVWKIIGEKAQNRNPQNIVDLWSFLKEWESTTATFCKKLIGSCGRRCNEVIQCKRKFTKYWIFLQFIHWSNKDLTCVPKLLTRAKCIYFFQFTINLL